MHNALDARVLSSLDQSLCVSYSLLKCRMSTRESDLVGIDKTGSSMKRAFELAGIRKVVWKNLDGIAKFVFAMGMKCERSDAIASREQQTSRILSRVAESAGDD
jgi:hypothetical protein